MPLAIGFGEGSELRQPLGVSIIGGLIASQLLTLLTTPVVYVLMDRFRKRAPAKQALMDEIGLRNPGIAPPQPLPQPQPSSS